MIGLFFGQFGLVSIIIIAIYNQFELVSLITLVSTIIAIAIDNQFELVSQNHNDNSDCKQIQFQLV